MPDFALEYTLCQMQSGQISVARRVHRREGRDPQLNIEVHDDVVEFTLPDLMDGVPQAVSGVRRQDHVDFYFLLDEFRAARNGFPAVAVQPNNAILLPTTDPSGMERPGGHRIRMQAPIFRLPVLDVELESNVDPVFRAVSDDAHIFADFETTPSTGLYTHELAEMHFGVNASFDIVESQSNFSRCVIRMSHEQYATWLHEVSGL